MSGILYTIGNKKIETVAFVAKAISEKFVNQNFDEIVIFNTKESLEILTDQVKCYKKYLGNFMFTNVDLDENGNVEQQYLNTLFAREGFKLVDLTNGQKTTAALIYMSASLCNVENIYYLMRKEFKNKENNYEYIKMEQFQKTASLSKISYFDLIYYSDEIDKIFDNKDILDNNMFLSSVYNGMKTGIEQFFRSNDYRSAVNNVTIGNEGLIKCLKKYLMENEICKKFNEDNGVKFGQKDPIGESDYFYKLYVKKGEDEEVLKLCTVPPLLSAIRYYRNLSAHDSQNKHTFTSHETRIAINMCIEVLKCAKKNKEFWGILERDNYVSIN